MIDLLYIFRLIYFSFFFFFFHIFYNVQLQIFNVFTIYFWNIQIQRYKYIWENKILTDCSFSGHLVHTSEHRIKINLWQLTHCLFAKNVKNKKKSWVFHTLIFKYGIQIENDKRKNSRIIYTKKIYICKAWLVMLIIYYKYICMKLI